jgi:uncharacterized protein YukE
VKAFWKTVGTALSLGLLAGTIWLLFNTQTTIDWWRLRSYEPSAEIASLATGSSFSDEGRRLFYVHYPELLDKPNFQGKCTTTEETIVLGCYISKQKIYIFDVDDPRLEGIEEVTAAHEMLHAVYDRLSKSEREAIDALVLDYFNNSTDERLIRTIEGYRKRDPSVVPNELHSILATEMRDLPRELENHYSKYFIDRLSVVALSEAYEDEFEKREQKRTQLEATIEELLGGIEIKKNQIESLGSALASEKVLLESLRSDVEEYNNAVPEFNRKVNEYNRFIIELRSEVSSVNELIAERNAIATEEQQLVEAIDTRGLEL